MPEDSIFDDLFDLGGGDDLFDVDGGNLFDEAEPPVIDNSPLVAIYT